MILDEAGGEEYLVYERQAFIHYSIGIQIVLIMEELYVLDITT